MPECGKERAAADRLTLVRNLDEIQAMERSPEVHVNSGRQDPSRHPLDVEAELDGAALPATDGRPFFAGQPGRCVKWL